MVTWFLIINPDENPVGNGRWGMRSYRSADDAMRDRDRINIQGKHYIISTDHLDQVAEMLNEVAEELALC